MASVGRTVPPAARTRSIPVYSYLAQKNRGYYLAGYTVLIFLGLWTAFPIYWQLATSVRSDADLYTPVVALIPRAWTLDHYYNVLFGARSQFGIQFMNSLIVGIATTVIAVFFGAMAGYALTRLRFLGRAGLARVLVYSYLAPGTILFIPLYVMMNSFGLRDTLTALVLAHLTFSVPFSTWVLMGYFKTIPVELEEAALVDGPSRWVLLWRIVMPLAAPAVVVCAVFAFSAS